MAAAKRSILITGAGSGLGQGLARLLAFDAALLILADLDLAAARATIDSLRPVSVKAKIHASAHALDVADANSVARLMHDLADTPVDVLINNAGLQHVAPIDEFPPAKWNQLLGVMLSGPFLMSQAVLPRMRENGFGRIINIGSIHSVVASPFKSAYVTAKHGLAGLVKAIALETGDVDITANNICPSYIRTPLVDKQIVNQAKANHISEQDVIDKIMLEPMPKKAFITLEEVAELARFLISDAARNISGQSILIDGGWTSR